MGQAWQRLALGAGVVLVALMPVGALGAVQGIGVSPTSLEVNLAPGGSSSGEITVINDGATDVNYKVYATDYRVNDESYVGNFDSVQLRADVSPVSWFTLPKGNFTVKSRLETKFNYTLHVPPTAAVGGHYGAIFIETIPPAGKGGAFVSRVERIGTLFYLTVGGDLHHSGSVLPLSVARLQSVAPVRGVLRLRNDGNVHFLAEGTASFRACLGPCRSRR